MLLGLFIYSVLLFIMVLEMVLVDEYNIIMNGDIEIYKELEEKLNRILFMSFMVLDLLYCLELDLGELFLCEEKWKKWLWY